MGEQGKLADPDKSAVLRQLHLRDIICCQTAYNVATGRDDPIGADFVMTGVRCRSTRRSRV